MPVSAFRPPAPAMDPYASKNAIFSVRSISFTALPQHDRLDPLERALVAPRRRPPAPQRAGPRGRRPRSPCPQAPSAAGRAELRQRLHRGEPDRRGRRGSRCSPSPGTACAARAGRTARSPHASASLIRRAEDPEHLVVWALASRSATPSSSVAQPGRREAGMPGQHRLERRLPQLAQHFGHVLLAGERRSPRRATAAAGSRSPARSAWRRRRRAARLCSGVRPGARAASELGLAQDQRPPCGSRAALRRLGKSMTRGSASTLAADRRCRPRARRDRTGR